MTSCSTPGHTNPFVFVVGCPRSGTTLLQRMLDNHPMLAVTNDTHFIPHVAKRFELESNTPLTPSVVEAVVSYRRFHRMGLDETSVAAAASSAPTFGAFVANLYSAVAEQRGKQLAGDKTPDYVRNLPLLHRLFPESRSLHIIRDGRDVALSALEWATPEKGPGRIGLWQTEPVAVCALWWRRNVRYGLRDGAVLGPTRHRSISYEMLAAEPENTMTEVADFLQIPDAGEMSRFHVGRTKSASKLSAKAAWLPATKGLRNWRDQLPDRDVALFEALAGDTLDELGYERATDQASPTIASVAEECRAWWKKRKWHRLSGSRTDTAGMTSIPEKEIP
ncbi:MAG: sulfotransferase family protein [Planctomycetota bacterium]|jgi:hypothetical protein